MVHVSKTGKNALARKVRRLAEKHGVSEHVVVVVPSDHHGRQCIVHIMALHHPMSGKPDFPREVCTMLSLKESLPDTVARMKRGMGLSEELLVFEYQPTVVDEDPDACMVIVEGFVQPQAETTGSSAAA